MPKLSASFSLVRLDLKAATKAIDEEMTAILKEAVAEWLRTILAIVPVWSGASHYAFKELADAVDVPVTAFPVTRTDSKGHARRAPDRRRMGLESSTASLNDTGPIYSFDHSTTLFHYLYNEENDATADGFNLIRPGPYHSRAKARVAFDSTIRPRIRNFKFDLKSYLRYKKQKVD